jgi:isopentenyl diphosphate isomerase/L-lactate dehydrogenase-like FMN-dependent dehydrogenase
VTELINVWDYERAAAELLDAPVLGYYAGGAGDEWTLRENVEAFRRWTLRPRVLCEVETIDPGTTVLGTRVSFPVLLAPVALQRLAHPDGELATARAADAAETLMCLSTIATATPEEVAAAAPGAPRWFQVYVLKDRGATRDLVARAAAAGYSALVLTADTPYLGRRERDIRYAFTIPEAMRPLALASADGERVGATILPELSPSVGWRDVEQLVADTNLPVLVKGVHTAEDAALALEHGAAGVIVSNHGGRQLDGVAAAIDMLPEIVETVAGRAEVLMDGGVRRGADVVKALALGARAVLVGRAFLWGLVVGGEEGVRNVLELLRAEMVLALALCGCTSPDELTRAHVGRAR